MLFIIRSVAPGREFVRFFDDQRSCATLISASPGVAACRSDFLLGLNCDILEFLRIGLRRSAPLGPVCLAQWYPVPGRCQSTE